MKAKEFIEFCFHQHDVVCNQKYDKVHYYSFHLNMVIDNSEKFCYVLYGPPNNYFKKASMIAAGHDLIEDARLTYNDIKDLVGEEVAEGIFLCTEFRGRNRSERKPDQFYIELRENKLATFVKLCDIMANTQYSIDTKSSMLKKGKDEWPRIKNFLMAEWNAPLIIALDKMYESSES